MKRNLIVRAILGICGVLAISACGAINLAANDKEPTKVSPETKFAPQSVSAVVERRETLTATGYAVISVQQHKNPAQQRLMAIRASKLDAYRSLTEQVYGQQLDANSTVADMIMTSDTFRAKVEGLIYGARLVSINPIGDDTYETTLSLDKDMVYELRRIFLSQVASNAQ